MDVYTTQISTFPSPRWLTRGPQDKSSILLSGIIGPHAVSPSSVTDHLPWTLTSCQGHGAMPVTGQLSAKGGLSLQTFSFTPEIVACDFQKAMAPSTHGFDR